MKCNDSVECKLLKVYDQASANRSLEGAPALIENLEPNDMVYVCDACVQQKACPGNPSDKICALCRAAKPVEEMIDKAYSRDNALFTFLRDACEKNNIDRASIPLFSVQDSGMICKNCKIDCVYRRIPRAIERVESEEQDQDTRNYIDALNDCLPLRVCSLCDELKGNKDVSNHTYHADDKIFNFLLESGQVDVSTMSCFQHENADEPMTLCKRCQKSCWSKRVPRCITANGLTWGDVPECLRDLTWAEERCIAKYNACTHICKLTGYQQHARVGGIVYLENDLLNIARSLPRTPSECNIVVFQVNSMWGSRSKGSTYTWNVRKQKVISALEWLFDNHPSYSVYKHEGVNMDNLAEWEDDKLEKPIVTVEHAINGPLSPSTDGALRGRLPTTG